jgi:hypothetical protein
LGLARDAAWRGEFTAGAAEVEDWKGGRRWARAGARRGGRPREWVWSGRVG